MKAGGVVRNHFPVESRDRCLRRRPRASCRKPARRYLIRLPRGKEELSALKRYTTNQRSASFVRLYRCGKVIDPHEYCQAAIPIHDVRDNTRKRNPPRDRRQPLGAQERTGQRLPRGASEGSPALHPDLLLVAQPGVPDLKRKLMRYIRDYNKAPKAVKWKYFDPSKRITSQSAVTGH
jgi:hypothetical protein